jgi:hypothetical protein
MRWTSDKKHYRQTNQSVLATTMPLFFFFPGRITAVNTGVCQRRSPPPRHCTSSDDKHYMIYALVSFVCKSTRMDATLLIHNLTPL